MKQSLILASLCSLALLGCGGGGGGESSSSSTTTTTASASTTTAASLGASSISSPAGTETFDLVASIGDTWRFVVTTSTGAFTVTPNNSQYGLSAETGTLTRTVSGDFVTYTLANRVSLVQDTRTKSVSGSMTVGGQTASVSGTQYQLGSSIASLAGTYNFFGSSRNLTASGGNYWPEVLGGQILVNADGTGKLCANGKYVGSTCTSIDVSQNGAQEVNARFTKDSTADGGFVKVEIWGANTNAWLNFGNLMIHPGDLGAAFMLDHFGINDEGVARVGNFFAVKAQTVAAGSAMNGTWKCDTPSGTATLVVSGTSNTITSPNQTPSTWTETLTFNKVSTSNNTLIDMPGFGVTTASDGFGAVFLPLSSSIAVVEHDSVSRVGLCYKAQ